MASRRPHSQSPADAVPPSVSEKPSDSDVTPAVPTHVIFKLLGFTAAMISAPIGMYFISVSFGSSATIAGVFAAITANIVLFAYIFVAWQEDQGEREALAKKKEKKAQ
ncbi:vacuolar ATPase assembly integral membrane protein vma21 [Aspergillus melleus]|uniref:Vacuolar ATPase assembly integral membrane protein vma21 n=1 Tax=Aspergillus melleus TaxID=138277 RepID=A0ACC3ARW5_9EURO|nr:vacuolar ATPase assembly integral membrane protein vma21 [Aspergillus melleus]